MIATIVTSRHTADAAILMYLVFEFHENTEVTLHQA